MRLMIAALLILAAVPTPARAQPPAQVLSPAQATAQCGPVGAVLKVLSKRYGERLFWWGAAQGGVTMLVTERPDTKTWTLLALHDGVACLVGSGGTRGAAGS